MDKEKESADQITEFNLAITENDLKAVSTLYMSCMLRLMGDDVPEMSNREIRQRVVQYLSELAKEYDLRAFGMSQSDDKPIVAEE